jgi:hypothetical protein
VDIDLMEKNMVDKRKFNAYQIPGVDEATFQHRRTQPTFSKRPKNNGLVGAIIMIIIFVILVGVGYYLTMNMW